MVEGHSSIPHVGALGREGQASIYQIFRVLSALSCGYWILQKTMQVKGRQSLPVRKLQSKHGNGTQVDPVVSCAGRCHQVVFSPPGVFRSELVSYWFDLNSIPFFPLCALNCKELHFPGVLALWPSNSLARKMHSRDIGRWEEGKSAGYFFPLVLCLLWCFLCSSSPFLSEPLPLGSSC